MCRIMAKRNLAIFLAFLLVTTAITVIYQKTWHSYFDFRSVSKPQKDVQTFLIIHRGATGEKEYASRVICAAKKFNWNGYSVSAKPPKWVKRFSITSDPLQKVLKKVKPDFIISTTKSIPYIDSGEKYLDLSHREFDMILDRPEQFSPQEWSGILSSPAVLEKLSSLYPNINIPLIEWFPSCMQTAFYQPNPKRLFYCGAHPATSANAVAMQKLFSLLDRAGYLDIYGTKKKWAYLEKSNRGPIDFDGTTILEAMHHSGISLILHSDYHFGNEIPSARIFESAAAGTVIISDKHPFIKEHFGDSVLYLDRHLSGEEMYAAVDKMVEWIWNHPHDAYQLAKKSHEIFTEIFTLEHQLERLKELREKSS